MKKITKILFFSATCLFFLSSASASESVGTIDSTYYTTRLCQNSDCSAYQTVNFRPPQGEQIIITDSSITGEIWLSQSGWVSLNPSGSGVINSENGVLSGMGFGQVASWVNFSPTNGGVSIDSNGEFVGWAWVSGVYGGWIKFDCSSTDTCIKTDWRPINARTSTENPPPPGGSGGGGGGNSGQGSFSFSSSVDNGPPSNIQLDVSTSSATTSLSFIEDTNSSVQEVIKETFDNVRSEIIGQVTNILKNNTPIDSNNYSQTGEGNSEPLLTEEGLANRNDNSIFISDDAEVGIEKNELIIIVVLIVAIMSIFYLRKRNGDFTKSN